MAKPRVRMGSNQKVVDNQGNESLEDLGRLITEAWEDMRRNAFKIGAWLLQARQKHPDLYLVNLLRQMNVPFGKRSAERYIAIAENPILTDATYELRLPAASSVLYLLSTLPEPELKTMLDDGRITPATEREDAEALVAKVREKGIYRYERVAEALSILVNFRQSWSDAANIAAHVWQYVEEGEHTFDLAQLDGLSGWVEELRSALQVEKERSEPAEVNPEPMHV